MLSGLRGAGFYDRALVIGDREAIGKDPQIPGVAARWAPFLEKRMDYKVKESHTVRSPGRKRAGLRKVLSPWGERGGDQGCLSGTVIFVK